MILHSSMDSGLFEKSKTTIGGAVSLLFHPKLLTAPVAVTHLGIKFGIIASYLIYFLISAPPKCTVKRMTIYSSEVVKAL